jgi:hypothetical protein
VVCTCKENARKQIATDGSVMGTRGSNKERTQKVDRVRIQLTMD